MAQYAIYNDGELVALLQQGDESAFREIYQRYREQLLGYAFNFSGDREDALDVVQDIFASLWKLRQELSFTHSLKAYLYQAARNGCITKATRMKRREELLQSLGKAMEENDASLQLQIDANETGRRIDEAIRLLPNKMQQVFRLSREEGLSHTEISERLDISPNTVKAQVQNALKLIRNHLGRFTLWSILVISRLFD